MLGLPEHVISGFVSGTSMAILCGLAAARYRVYKNANWDVNKKGLNGSPKLRVVAGRQVHGTVVKALALLGFGIDAIEWVNVDRKGRILSKSLPIIDETTILILQAGNVSTGSFDEFDGICDRANKTKAWIHIDGAFGLWAAASNRLKKLTKGIEKANSWSVDAHKTLNMPYDSGIFLCADKEAAIGALQVTGSYVVYSEHRDGMMYTPEMSRRARIVELWATLKYLGQEGVDELVFNLHERAVQFKKELAIHGFKVINKVVFNQILVDCGDDNITKKMISNIQDTGECWVGGSQWMGYSVIRISVCSWVTTKADVTRSVLAFIAARDKIAKDD